MGKGKGKWNDKALRMEVKGNGTVVKIKSKRRGTKEENNYGEVW